MDELRGQREMREENSSLPEFVERTVEPFRKIFAIPADFFKELQHWTRVPYEQGMDMAREICRLLANSDLNYAQAENVLDLAKLCLRFVKMQGGQTPEGENNERTSV